jgi:ribonucleotide reductase beta subunit family protein with ferritin-like domain
VSIDKNSALRLIGSIFLFSCTYKKMSLFPIQHKALYDLYRQSVQSFWIPDEVDLSKDDPATLKPAERNALLRVLAFFAASDAIVADNCMTRFISDVPFKESKAFLAMQAGIEAIHNEMYSLLIDRLGADERDRLFDGINEFPAIKTKAQFCEKYMDHELPFNDRVVAFACIEGILFSSSFAVVFWFKTKGKLHGLVQSNELIARDEGLHVKHGCEMYKLLARLSDQRVYQIVREAVAAEKSFVEQEMLAQPMIGLTADKMNQYVEYVADHIISMLGHRILYGATNPLDYMELISLQTKTNFFEARVSEYKRGGNDVRTFTMDEDF